MVITERNSIDVGSVREIDDGDAGSSRSSQLDSCDNCRDRTC